MTDQATAPTTETAAPAAESPLDSAIRQVFGDEAAEAVGITPLVKTDAAEPEKPTEKPKVDAKESRRIIAARESELRRAKAQREADTKLADIAKREEALKDLTALAEQAKAAKTSPSKLLALAGLTPKDFLESLATEHEPEAIARRVAEETKSETQKLREQLEQIQREREADAVRAKKAEADRDYANEARVFVDMVTSNAEALPHMQSLTERRLMSLVEETIGHVVGHDENGRPITENEAFFAQKGRFPTNDEIAQYIEHLLAEEAGDTLSARRARTGQSTPQAPRGTPGESKSTPSDSPGHSPRTLTARVAASRAAPQKKPEDMTQQELDEMSQAIWDQAHRSRRSG